MASRVAGLGMETRDAYRRMVCRTRTDSQRSSTAKRLAGILRAHGHGGPCDSERVRGYVRHVATVQESPEMLEADPELFQHDIWRLLETDTIAFRYAHFGWPDLLVELCQAGKLDRAKLLARCVYGMSLPLSVTTLGGLVKFHDQLSPSNTERQVLLQEYLRLLHQNHAGVVSLAINALDKLHRVEQLPLEDFVQHLPAVFAIEKKGAVKSALKLADSLAWQNRDAPGLRELIQAVMGGLQHADADVQSATVELMRWRPEIIDAELVQAIASCSETVAAAVKPELKKLLANAGAIPMTTPLPRQLPLLRPRRKSI